MLRFTKWVEIFGYKDDFLFLFLNKHKATKDWSIFILFYMCISLGGSKIVNLLGFLK